MRKRKHGKKCPVYYKHISPITLQRKVNVEKDVFSSCHERGIEKNSESPRGIELQTFGFASIGAQIRRSDNHKYLFGIRRYLKKMGKKIKILQR